MSELSIVGWLWRDARCRTQYEPEHVNVWAAMIERNITLPHRFIVVTDQPKAKYLPFIEPLRLWNDWREVRCEQWPRHFPQAWMRIRAFSKEMKKLFGPRFVNIDLDCVVTGNLDAILGRKEDFVICRRAPVTKRDIAAAYQSSMWLLKAGSRTKVWTEFHGENSLGAIARKYPPDEARPFFATDQGWILYTLGPKEATWDDKDGIYFWPWLRVNKKTEPLPENARIVFFQGSEKPWTIENPPGWVRENYKNK